jgi:enoyl-CoA hydratase/carnithine racemase
MEYLTETKYCQELKDIWKEHKQKLDQQLIIPFKEFKYMTVTELNSFIILIRFDNGKEANRLDTDFCKELYTIEQKYLQNNSKFFLIFVGNHKNTSFTTGADLQLFNKVDSAMKIFRNLSNYFFYRMNYLYTNRTLFIWNGLTMGGGLGISNCSRFRVATESTAIAMPEARFGYMANCFFNHFISKMLSDKREAIHMAILSHVYKGYEIYLKNLATHFILNKYINELITNLSQLESLDLDKIDTIIKSIQIKSENESKELIKKSNFKIKEFDGFIENVYSFDFVLDYESGNFLEFLEKLKINLKGIKNGNKILKELENRSLLSLNTNYNMALSSYKNLSFEEYYDLDIYSSLILTSTGDPEEGIRAFFIDKDMKPKWKSRY